MNRFCALILCALAPTLKAQVKLSPNSLREGEQCGESVAIDGHLAVVGAPADGLAASHGAAYVYEKRGATWTLLAKLAEPQGNATMYRFGASVAVSGDTILIGAPGYNRAAVAPTGGVYVFRRQGNQFPMETLLLPSNRRTTEFGTACFLRDSVAVVGAPTHGGAAFVFRQADGQWTEEARLRPSRTGPGHQFGISVCTDGMRVIVGRPEVQAYTKGAAFIYKHDAGSWPLEATLVASDGEAGDAFGWSVALEGDVALVGRPGSDGLRSEGAAYLYRLEGSNWKQRQIVTVDDGFEQFNVARSVAYSGGTAILGALGSGGIPDKDMCGAAYVFHLSGRGMQQQRKIYATDPTAESFFGYSVATSQGCQFVGARFMDLGKGAAYVYCGSASTSVIPPCDPNQRPSHIVEPVPYLETQTLAGPASANSLESVVFTRDSEAMRLLIRNDAQGLPLHDECHSSSMRVEVTVGDLQDQFVEGLEDRTFLLRPGEEQEILVTVRPMESLLYTGELRHDILFGVRVHVKISTDDREVRVLREEDCFLYRLLDVSDNGPHDGVLRLADVLDDDAGGAVRHRYLAQYMESDAIPTLRFAASTTFTIEQSGTPKDWSLPANSVLSRIVHDPTSVGDERSDLELLAPDDPSKVVHTFAVHGRGTEANKIALNRAGMESQLARLALLHTPGVPTQVRDAVSEVLVTPGETALFDDPAERMAISSRFVALFKDRYQEVLEGFEFVANGAGSSNNLVQFHWALWPSIGRFGHAFKPNGPTVGVEGAAAILDLVLQPELHTRAELYYRLAGLYNESFKGDVTVFLDTPLERNQLGNYELGRMDADGVQDTALGVRQYLGSIVKTATHELAHTLSLVHSAQSDYTGYNEAQALVIKNAAANSQFRLTFEGHATPLLPHNATAEQVATALRALTPLRDDPWVKFSPNGGSWLWTPQPAAPQRTGGETWNRPLHRRLRKPPRTDGCPDPRLGQGFPYGSHRGRGQSERQLAHRQWKQRTLPDLGNAWQRADSRHPVPPERSRSQGRHHARRVRRPCG